MVAYVVSQKGARGTGNHITIVRMHSMCKHQIWGFEFYKTNTKGQKRSDRY